MIRIVDGVGQAGFERSGTTLVAVEIEEMVHAKWSRSHVRDTTNAHPDW